MDAAIITKILTKAGYNVLGTEGGAIILEDPACVFAAFADFVEFAWIAVGGLTMILLFGWGIALIRGAKMDIVANMRNLFLLFGGLSVAPALVDFLAGGQVFACKKISVSVSEVNRLLDMKGGKIEKISAADLHVEVIPAAAGTRAYGTVDGDVVYTDADGNRWLRRGGTRAWRNNNPGNIRYSDFARAQGAIGEAGGFSVFPDAETGARAIRALLRADTYQSLTVFGAINRYAPPFENDTAAYQRRVEQLTGLPGNRRMSSLNNEELERVVHAIRQVEGWTPGTVTRL